MFSNGVVHVLSFYCILMLPKPVPQSPFCEANVKATTFAVQTVHHMGGVTIGKMLAMKGSCTHSICECSGLVNVWAVSTGSALKGAYGFHKESFGFGGRNVIFDQLILESGGPFHSKLRRLREDRGKSGVTP